MTFPPDYAERVYAGVLGKIIGVYLGRPFEGWTHEQIMANLGEIKYYVNDHRDLPLRNHQLVYPVRLLFYAPCPITTTLSI